MLMKKRITSIIFALCLLFVAIATPAISSSVELKHRPATNLAAVNYARNLLLSVVDSSFRSSWVVDPKNWEEVTKATKKLQKSFNSLANIKIGATQRDVRKILKNPQETRNSNKIWIYGTPNNNGSYNDLLEVFFDDKLEHVIGVISFDPKSIVEKTGVNIGDDIDKMISVYGEPVDEKDFIEDPDNKEYLGMYYLYPRSGIGFLIGKDTENNLSVQGILVFGNSKA